MSIDNLKNSIAPIVRELVEKDPNIMPELAAKRVVEHLCKNPGPNHEADDLVKSMIGHLARAAHAEHDLRLTLAKLPPDMAAVYSWEHLRRAS